MHIHVVRPIFFYNNAYWSVCRLCLVSGRATVYATIHIFEEKYWKESYGEYASCVYVCMYV